MENQMSFESGEITLAAWGGPGGDYWSFKAKDGVKQIIIRYGDIIDSIIFKDTCDGDSAGDCSAKFGGPGGGQTEKININFPSEHLTGITLTHGKFSDVSKLVTSLKFHTNLAQYGPFGKVSGDAVSFNAESGLITGFHGRAGTYIDAIGVYMKPASSVFETAAMKESLDSIFNRLTRSAGPWGSMNGDGREWDDGVFTAVKEVCVDVSFVSSTTVAVRFLYEKKDGKDFLSTMHGGAWSLGHHYSIWTEKFKITGDEFLTGIEGFYGPMDGVDVIKSLTFHTNKRKYGPFGDEIGTYFSSMSSKAKVVGFFGRSGAYLNAIGIHSEYLEF